ncbi:MAG: type IV toxin-antitoxin system AbiEi family antitoxin [Deltaproteobacteria bacterium]|nr:type IV toxin-antitoxin system AbiEi family antitoxin [Deltaproteobacteria bacterium]
MRKLQAEGRYFFTTKDAVLALKKSTVAVRASVRRFKSKGFIVSPVRGFHIIIPPEYQSLGCLPPEQFIPDLMNFLKQPYYVGLLTAAQFHGASHQKPQEFQVVVPKNRKKIKCGSVLIHFIARQFVKDIPKLDIKTPRGFVAISSPEATALDLVSYPQYVGGLNNVVTILYELLEKMDAQKMILATQFVSELSSLQRLGFLFDSILKKKKFALPLFNVIKKRVKAFVPLVPSASKKGAKPNDKWKILINMKIEADL